MAMIKRVLLYGGLAIALSLSGMAMANDQQTITIAADEWCPYNCGEGDENPGYMVEIVRAAFGKSDIAVTYKVVPWSQAIAKTRAGEYEALVGAARGDAPDFLFPDVLQGISINQIWVRKDSAIEYKNLDSLNGMKLGIIEDYSYGKKVDPYLKKRISQGGDDIKVISSENATESNIADLVAGNLDVILEDKNVVEYYFASRNLPMPLKAVGNSVDIEDYEDTFIYVAFGPGNPKAKEYTKLLTKGVQEMRRNGELKAILTKYNVSGTYQFLGKKSSQSDVSLTSEAETEQSTAQ
jgi:polar amino acid transport system substrate-binding protein